jgi:hypothetical protein
VGEVRGCASFDGPEVECGPEGGEGGALGEEAVDVPGEFSLVLDEQGLGELGCP